MQNNFYCHTCNARLVYNQDYLKCLGCDKRYPVIENMPVFIEDLSIDQVKNKLCTDELFNETLKQNNAKISGEYEKLPPLYFKLFAEENRFKRVLDLGCGDGLLVSNLLQYENFIEEIYGLDISSRALLAF